MQINEIKCMLENEVIYYNQALFDVQEIIGKMMDENAAAQDNADIHDTLFMLDRAVVKLYLTHEDDT